MNRRFLEADEDDPILSVVNVVDVFLVVIAILLVIVASNPLNPFSNEDMVVVTNPGADNMTITIRDGEKLTRYESTAEIGEGQGVLAGTTYRLGDGSLIYVPEAPAR
jgi:hypothetical protein